MGAILYYRQSKESNDSISIPIQQAACREYANAHGWEVVAEIADEGNSGTEHRLPWRRRDHFPEVMALAEAGGIDTLVVYRWSRLSRTRRAQIEITDLLDKQGVTVRAATEDFDPTTAGGRFARDQMLSFAAFEADLKGEQWREAQANRIRRGLPGGGGPKFGYYRETVETESGRKPVGLHLVDPVTGPILREMYLRYAAGSGFRVIRDYLNERGVPTVRGGHWRNTRVASVLDSGFGAGLLIHRGKPDTTYFPGAHEPVISPEDWRAYQSARAHRRRPRRQQPASRWYLSGIVVCGKCLKSMLRLGGGHVDLCCSANRDQGKVACDGTFIAQPIVERVVAAWIEGHVQDIASGDDAAAREANVVTGLDERLAAVLRRLARLAELRADGELDADGYRGARARALGEKHKIEALRAHHHGATPGGPPTPDDRVDLPRRMLERVEIHDDRVVIVPVTGKEGVIARRVSTQRRPARGKPARPQRGRRRIRESARSRARAAALERDAERRAGLRRRFGQAVADNQAAEADTARTYRDLRQLLDDRLQAHGHATREAIRQALGRLEIAAIQGIDVS
jgi:DNA invertase Pin-like site-specific DNA recombinase